jgi:hypothetical protein
VALAYIFLEAKHGSNQSLLNLNIRKYFSFDILWCLSVLKITHNVHAFVFVAEFEKLLRQFINVVECCTLPSTCGLSAGLTQSIYVKAVI